MFAQKIAWKLKKQDYATKTQQIQGVQFFELKEFADDGGSFLELGRCTKGLLSVLPNFEIRQINYSMVLPGTIKATHIHKNQEDIWFVPSSDRVLVGLCDLREKSPTVGVTMRFVLGAGKSRLLLIPRGVAHGLANPWTLSTTMMYFVNQHFSSDPETCDEYRLDPYFFGKNFWNIHYG